MQIITPSANKIGFLSFPYLYQSFHFFYLITYISQNCQWFPYVVGCLFLEVSFLWCSNDILLCIWLYCWLVCKGLWLLYTSCIRCCNIKCPSFSCLMLLALNSVCLILTLSLLLSIYLICFLHFAHLFIFYLFFWYYCMLDAGSETSSHLLSVISTVYQIIPALFLGTW